MNEYIISPPCQFERIDFSGGDRLPHVINSCFGDLEVYTKRSGRFVFVGAFLENTPLSNPISFVGFEKFDEGIARMKIAQTDEQYQRKHIGFRLVADFHRWYGCEIVSDTEITRSGILFWNLLVTAPFFRGAIYYQPTQEIFEFSDIGNTKTSDGSWVIAPRDNRSAHGVYCPIFNKTGQKFFYILNPSRKI